METGTLGERRQAEFDESSTASRILEAREQERAMVAADLHDGPAQVLTNLIFQVDIIERALRDDPDEARTELQNLRQQLQRELDHLREFIHQLHPSLGSGQALDEALRELAADLVRDGLDVDYQLEAPEELLDGPRSMAVLRVAQEALRNVKKHASATRVRLATFMGPGNEASGNDGFDDERWILEVTDDGTGFRTAETGAHSGQRHFGLRFMRERAQLIGARLDVVSLPGHGTTVRLALEPARRN
jgi:two-component system, NarL family, sensor histidine kinase DegS